MVKRIIFLTSVLGLISVLMSQSSVTAQDREIQARRNVAPNLMQHFGRAVFIRIIKEDFELELWLRQDDGWQIFKRYPIAGMSGTLGPKEREGDCQAPEGFYRVFQGALNPHSRYYLSFNIGYPNEYDRSLGRTGSNIMVHGSDVSIGCFAMTDAGVEEIYTLVAEALRAGQEYVPVQVYPFRMTEERLREEQQSPHYSFWLHLLPGWQHTENCSEPWPDSDN